MGQHLEGLVVSSETTSLGGGKVPASGVIGLAEQLAATVALRDVGLPLRLAHCVGLVGRNGPGKSTAIGSVTV